jgi:hypothetical protein
MQFVKLPYFELFFEQVVCLIINLYKMHIRIKSNEKKL